MAQTEKRGHETTAEKLQWLAELRDEARHAGLAEVGREAARRGQAARARARREALRSRVVRRARPLRPPPRAELRDARAAPLRRRRRHRLRHDLRPARLRLQPGLHRVRRLAERGVRREDLQGDGHGGQVRLPADRDQRLGRRAHPGGRRLARRLRGDLLAERPELGRDPADLARDGALRRRRRLLARDHRLRADGRGDVVHVHHRARRREDGHRRRGDVRGARRRRHARVEVRRRAPDVARRGVRARGRALSAQLPAAVERASCALRRADRSDRSGGARARRPHPRRADQAVRHQARHLGGRRRR